MSMDILDILLDCTQLILNYYYYKCIIIIIIMPVTSISDIYNLSVISTIPEPLFFLLSKGFIREVGNQVTFNIQSRINLNQTLIAQAFTINVVIRNTGNLGSLFQVDQWKVATVYYKNQPIMIIRNELYYFRDGYSMKYITDSDTYKTMTWDVINNLQEDIVINNSIYYFNIRELFGDFINYQPQIIVQPEVYDLAACIEAVNEDYING